MNFKAELRWLGLFSALVEKKWFCYTKSAVIIVLYLKKDRF